MVDVGKSLIGSLEEQSPKGVGPFLSVFCMAVASVLQSSFLSVPFDLTQPAFEPCPAFCRRQRWNSVVPTWKRDGMPSTVEIPPLCS